MEITLIIHLIKTDKWGKIKFERSQQSFDTVRTHSNSQIRYLNKITFNKGQLRCWIATFRNQPICTVYVGGTAST